MARGGDGEEGYGQDETETGQQSGGGGEQPAYRTLGLRQPSCTTERVRRPLLALAPPANVQEMFGRRHDSPIVACPVDDLEPALPPPIVVLREVVRSTGQV